MKQLLATLLALTLISCGGGGGDAPTPAPSPIPAPMPAPSPAPIASVVHFQGLWSGTRSDSTVPIPPPATLTIRPIAGEMSISTNAVTRVEARVGQAAPLVLAAPNSTDSSGRPQYVFNFGRPAEATNCSRFFPQDLPITVTVVDTTGFSFTKNVATCASSALDFGAFSDYGSTTVQYSYSASAPITALITSQIDRRSPFGDFSDVLIATSQSSFNAVLPGATGNVHSILPIFNQVPDGTRIRSRIDAGGGTFAESTIVWPPKDMSSPSARLNCCGPVASGSGATRGLRIFMNTPNSAAAATYSYSYQITDPATGIVIDSQSGTTSRDAVFDIAVQPGHVIEVSATPNDPRASVEITVGTRLNDSVNAGSNEVGTPARFKVYCCQQAL